ncbi:chitin disaccharide deacetylase [Oscillospiraceae bacterium MB08-C2-2]|nr:chitin disaccharide deacetylase [Oscillospiraceae bacterium MB08-C2-2]
MKKSADTQAIKIIFNADDFGICRAVNYGILDAFRLGVVRSTSLMATGDAYEHAVEIAQSFADLDIGVHLSLTHGQPITARVSSMLNAQGQFISLAQFNEIKGKLDIAAIEEEFTAQIEKILASGLKPTHLDSHHHIHMMASLFPLALKLAKKYKLAIRLRSRSQLPQEYSDLVSPELLMEEFYGDQLTEDQLAEILYIHEGKTSSLEIMCHPGYLDTFLNTHSSYSSQRINELNILTDPKLRQVIETFGAELISYAQLTAQ